MARVRVMLRFRFLFCFILCLSAGGFTALADTLTLHSGETLEGNVRYEDDDYLILVTDDRSDNIVMLSEIKERVRGIFEKKEEPAVPEGEEPAVPEDGEITEVAEKKAAVEGDIAAAAAEAKVAAARAKKAAKKAQQVAASCPLAAAKKPTSGGCSTKKSGCGKGRSVGFREGWRIFLSYFKKTLTGERCLGEAGFCFRPADKWSAEHANKMTLGRQIGPSVFTDSVLGDPEGNALFFVEKTSYKDLSEEIDPKTGIYVCKTLLIPQEFMDRLSPRKKEEAAQVLGHVANVVGKHTLDGNTVINQGIRLLAGKPAGEVTFTTVSGSGEKMFGKQMICLDPDDGPSGVYVIQLVVPFESKDMYVGPFYSMLDSWSWTHDLMEKEE